MRCAPLLWLGAAAQAVRPWLDPALEPDVRAAELVAAMTPAGDA